MLLVLSTSNKMSADLYGQQAFFDHAFGDTGTVRMDIDDYDEVIKLVTLTDASTLALAHCGHADSTGYDMDFAMIKLDPSGNADASFGVNGVVKMDFLNQDFSSGVDMLIQPDNKIVVAGRAYKNDTPGKQAFWACRFETGGEVDTTFGTAGFVSEALLGPYQELFAADLDDHGNIYLAGTTFDSTAVHNELPAIVKLLPNGTPDSSFAGTGKLALSFLNGTIIPSNLERHVAGGMFSDIKVLENGKILCAGSYNSGINLMGLLVRFDPNGSLDSTFADSGIFVHDIEPGYDSQFKKFEIRNDKLFLSVDVDCSFYANDFYLMKVDTSLSTIPLLSFYHSGFEEEIKSLIFQPDGKLLIGGYASLPTNYSSSYTSDYFSLMRLYTDGISQDFTFNSSGSAHWNYEINSRCGSNDIVIDVNDKILMGGFTYINNDPTQSDLIITRLNSHLVDMEEEVDLPMHIYPNPTTNQFNINSSQNLDFVEMFALDGRLIKKFSAPGPYNISWAPSGSYVIKFGTQKSILIKN